MPVHEINLVFWVKNLFEKIGYRVSHNVFGPLVRLKLKQQQQTVTQNLFKLKYNFQILFPSNINLTATTQDCNLIKVCSSVMCSYFSLFKPLMLRSMFFQHRGLMWVDLTCEKQN